MTYESLIWFQVGNSGTFRSELKIPGDYRIVFELEACGDSENKDRHVCRITGLGDYKLLYKLLYCDFVPDKKAGEERCQGVANAAVERAVKEAYEVIARFVGE